MGLSAGIWLASKVVAGSVLLAFVLVRLCIMAEERDRSQIDDPYDTDYWNEG